MATTFSKMAELVTEPLGPISSTDIPTGGDGNDEIYNVYNS